MAHSMQITASCSDANTQPTLRMLAIQASKEATSTYLLGD